MRNGPYELLIAPPDYPGTKYRGRYVYEHHLVWWRKTGQVVPTGYTLHHVNEQKRDNRFENLELMTRSDHKKHHATPPEMAEPICGWCNQSFKLEARKMRTRLKVSRSGRIFCCRSHQASYQHSIPS